MADSSSGRPLLRKAIRYCWSDEFLDVFRRFFSEQAHHFDSAAEEKTDEHDLVYDAVFQDYLKLFETKMEDFMIKQGSTVEEFYELIHEHRDSENMNIQLFIKCLLASTNYENFYRVIVNESRRQLDEKKDFSQFRKNAYK